MSNIYTTSFYTEFTNLDLFYEEILGINPNGRFIEIGAFDGHTNSKTAHLADIGWEGIYIEPIKEYRDQCINRHRTNNVTVLPYAISDKNETLTMYKGGLPSTLVASQQEYISDFMKQHSSELNFTDERVVSITWDSFLRNHKVGVPDILVVDAEGFDLEIISSIDFENFRPTIICCEIFPESIPFIHPTVISEGKKIVEKLKDNGYNIWLQEHHNILFSTKPIPKSLTEINEEFPHLFDLSNNRKLKPRAISLLRQLLKTLVSSNNLNSYPYLIDLFATLVDGSLQADVNLLALSLMLVNKKTEADNLLQWSQQNAENFDISNCVLQILNATSFDGNVSKKMNQLIDQSPFDIRYVALRKLQMKA